MVDIKNVKLVVSDMDGTLLHSDYSLNPEFFDVYKKLKDSGITFCAASGRQYDSLVNIFNSIKDEVYFIAENGGYVVYKEKTLITQGLTSDLIKEVVEICRKLPQTEVLLCGLKSAYVEKSAPDFAEHIIPYYPKNKTIPDLLMDIDDLIVKIAIYNPTGTEENVYPAVKYLEENFQVKISGKHWLDVSIQTSNKGVALEKVQQLLNISKEETVVFGDYLNDLEMMDRAYFSFAMENAHPYIKEKANFQTASNNEDGVIQVLKKIIENP